MVFMFVMWSSCTAATNGAFASAEFGRFVGFLHHEHRAQDQAARLDFIKESEDERTIKLRATLVLYFGNFDSDEYASYEYRNVSYDKASGTLVFDGAERELHFIVEAFRGEALEAKLRTALGVVGQLQLQQQNTVKVERPLVQRLWGEYRGVCEGVGRRLQIQSSPSHPIATNRTDPFAPFIIMAQIGDNGGAGCPTGASTCVTKVFHDSDYDIFTGHIDFHGAYGSMPCSVDEGGITCGTCRYNRSSGESVRGDVMEFKVSSPQWTIKVDDRAPEEGVDGVYKGFVHLERMDVYRPMSISVTTYPSTSGTDAERAAGLVSVISSIRYGGHTDTDESINTKFDPRPLTQGDGELVFDRSDNTTDMILTITRIGGGVAEGRWFSRRFGFVGRFALASSGSILLSDPSKLDTKLAGGFSDGKLNIDMIVAMSDRATSSKDPFSPLTIQGNVWYTDLSPRKPFSETSFDPFTGKFALDTDGPGGAYIGMRTKKGIKLKVPNQGILRPMQSHSFIELMEVSK
jgi:hypothetical protein